MIVQQRRMSLDSNTHIDNRGHFQHRFPQLTRGLFDRRNAVTNLDVQESELGIFTTSINQDHIEELPRKSKISQLPRGSQTDKPKRRKSALDNPAPEKNADTEMEKDGVHEKVKERIEITNNLIRQVDQNESLLADLGNFSENCSHCLAKDEQARLSRSDQSTFTTMEKLYASDPKNFTSNLRRMGIVPTSGGQTMVRVSTKKICIRCLTTDKLEIGAEWPYDHKFALFMATESPRRKYPLTSVFFSLLNCHRKRVKSYLSNKTLMEKLLRFVLQIEKSYQHVPYHNLHHAVDVLLATETLMNMIEEAKILSFSGFERITTLLAAACHDVAHPSVNSMYVVKQTGKNAESSSLKNVSEDGQGLLEKCHLKIALKMMKDHNLTEFLENQKFLDLFETLIMATDMSRHGEQMKGLRECKLKFGKLKTAQKNTLLGVVLHLADLSNPMKQFSEAYDWALKVCQEFYEQGFMEKKILGGVSTDLNDKHKTTIEKCQVGFINFVVLPLVEGWCDFLKRSEGARNMKDILLSNRDMYAQMS